MAEFKPLILKAGKKALAVIGDIIRFPDHVIFNHQINIGTSANSTDGNLKYDSDFFGRVGGIWKSLTRINSSDITEVVFDTVTTTASTSFGVMSGMTIVPPAGKYKIEVSLDVKMAGTFCAAEFGLYQNTTLIPATFRGFGGDNPYGTVHMVKIVTCNGTDPINIRYRTLNATRTVTIVNRSMLLTRLY